MFDYKHCVIVCLIINTACNISFVFYLIEDLRAELATPSSPCSTPRIPKSVSLDPAMFASGARTAGVLGSKTASSPTAALAKLRFEQCLTAGVTTQVIDVYFTPQLAILKEQILMSFIVDSIVDSISLIVDSIL